MSENDIDEKHLPSRPPDANALLKLPPGVLNEGLDVDPSSPFCCHEAGCDDGEKDTDQDGCFLHGVIPLLV